MNTEPLKGGDRVTFVEYARTVAAEVIGNDKGLLYVRKEDGRFRWIRADYVSRDAGEAAAPIYALDVTRKYGRRARFRWYFDSAEQFECAWALAVEHGENPVRTGLVPYVPADDIVTDADELSMWLRGAE